MGLLSTLKSDDSIANEKDSVGGNFVLDSGLLLGTISLAYITMSEGGAMALNVEAKTAKGNIRDQFWMTSGKEKGQKNYYEKDGEKHYLPGFNQANALALLTTGTEISDLDTEKKTIKLWNKEAKAEVPTQVDMVTDLLGKEILIGVLKVLVDKTAKAEGSNEYKPTGETMEKNEIDKLFRASDRKTTAEIRAKAEEAAFADAWEAKWAGKLRDKSTKVAGGAKAAGATGGATKPAKQSLFS